MLLNNCLVIKLRYCRILVGQTVAFLKPAESDAQFCAPDESRDAINAIPLDGP